MTSLSDFSFIDFRIVKLNFATNNQFNNQGQTKVRTEFKIRHESNNDRLKVFLTIKFNEKTAPFSVNLEGIGMFELNRNITGYELESLCNNHCSMVMFPYMREVVADISRRAGFPPLHIPQIDFAQVFNQQTGEAGVYTLH
ncbi:MAG: protein-export chaperone SecB [Thermodesulfobacteriota bacterium]|nr:protein-export chaperone SecB [Thermodesulfobacteriota bacterium]